jgi:hypothetical protein
VAQLPQQAEKRSTGYINPLRRRHREARASFVFVLTHFNFRKIVDTQRQKIDAHTLGGNA